MAVENITLNLIPTGDTPSIHVAQFDVERPFTVTLKEGADDFTPTGYGIELQVRKVDNNIVTAIPTSTSGNVVTFNTTEQMTACSGTNLAELQLTKNSQTFATLHFYLVVQRDVLAGGVTSESDIYNLTEQIAAIVPEVIGDDYYDKMEVDALIAEHTFDPTNYYDKSDVDTLLNNKADISDLPDMSNYYDKSDVDTLLNGKADVSDLPDMSNYYNKTEVDNKITDLYQIKTASGNIVHITDGGDNIPLKSCKVTIAPDLSGHTQCVVSVADSNNVVQATYTITFGTTVYGGEGDVVTGEFVSSWVAVDLGTINYNYNPVDTNFYSRTTLSNVKYNGSYGIALCQNYFINNVPGASMSDGGFKIQGDRIYIKDTRYTDENAFKAALSGVILIYETTSPTTLSLTPVQPKTISGINNIYNDCGDCEVNYFTNKSDGIAELIKAFM